jgi:NADPH:quinone reductase-like Zn-dependent oxidoreductase
VGTFAVQIAALLGGEVTAVCSARNAGMVRDLGATHVIDYTREDFARNGQRYDLILAANGYRPIGDYRRALAPGGVYVVSGGSMTQIFQGILLGPVLSRWGDKRMGNVAATPNAQDLATVGEWLEKGTIRAVIDRCYPLSEAAEAFRYLEQEHARGKVVINVVGV